MLSFCENILWVHRNKNVRTLGLAANQQSLIFLDLHCSHKYPSVLKWMKDHYFSVVFIAAGCTDIFQVGDRVANSPMKSGCKAAWSLDYHDQFTGWHVANPTLSPDLWIPKFNMSDVKPRICGFLAAGLARLRTPAMKAAIAKSFLEDACVAQMMDPAVQAEAIAFFAAQSPAAPAAAAAVVPAGEEKEPDEVADDV